LVLGDYPPHKDILGKIHYEVVPDIPLKWKLLHRRCLKGEHLKCEEDIFYRKDGQIDWIKWEIAPWYMPDNTLGGLFMFIEHLTEHKNNEKKMETMINELRRYNSALKRFAHICAHDMRAPLRTIYSYIELLEEKIEVQEELTTYMEHVKASILYINNLIKDMLSYAETDILPLKLKDLNLEYVINNIMTVLHKDIEEKKVLVFYKDLPTLYGDEVLLNQLFQNLISNSIKYNKSETPIVKIKARELKRSWIICVEDNGIGIELKYFKAIFEPLERLHSNKEYAGSGLGLAQCKKIVESHKGKIWVRSEVNKGTKFNFLIPKKDAI
jgi:light-regulated signal transduction histidine kinase (bacteriophytochrome)